MDRQLKAHHGVLGWLLWTMVCAVSAFNSSYAFDDRVTHPQITFLAVDASKLDATLKASLGITDGKDAKLRPASGLSQSVLVWLQTGSTREDDPPCRASNHFHNPLKEYATGGVTDLTDPIRIYCAGQGFNPIRSSATWGTKYTSPTQKETSLTTKNDMDWDIARTAYFDALTKGTSAERDQHLAKTFQALGQVLHLVQDLAVPAHVRDDFASHKEYFEPNFTPPLRWWSNDFERYVRRNSTTITASQSLDPNSFANQPVTRFWDTGQYRQRQTPSRDFAQGLAEYTNANFFSQNTPFTDALPSIDPHHFPHPARANTTLPQLLSAGVLPSQVYAEDGIPDTVLYVEQIQGPGEPSLLLAKAGFFHKPILAKDSAFRTLLPLGFQLDDQVMAAYAARLLPRAVAYSAGLLDYFFRGDLDFQVTLEKDPAAVTEPNQNLRPPFRFAVVIQNRGSDPMDGEFFLYADTGDSDAPDSWHRDLVVAKTLVLSRAGEWGATYPMPPQTPLFFTPPANLKRLILVFKGALGAEAGNAVAAKVKSWDMPVAFAIQESTELLGEVEREETMYTSYLSWIMLYNRAGQQRLTGRLATQGRSLTGKDIQRISLEGNSGGNLRVDGIPGVWTRGTSEAPDPTRWEIVTDFASAFYRLADETRASLPTTITVETVAGFKTKTPLVLWAWVQSSGEHKCSGNPWSSYYDHCRYIRGVLFYGDGDTLGNDPITTPLNYQALNRRIPITTPETFVGFVPVGVGGDSVGVTVDIFGDAVFDDKRFAWRIDDDLRYWDKNGFKFYLEKGVEFVTAVPEPEPIPSPPTVQVKRFYFSEELEAYGRLGVQPPDNDAVITLQ
jgi:hypothetical protein